jgi:RNA polymerase II elongation factor ELL
VRHGDGETPKGLGISSGVSKSKEDNTTSAATGSSKGKKDQNPQKSQANGINTPKTTSTSGTNHKSTEENLKRKADMDKNGLPPPKHRKTTSTSSQSHASGNNGNSSTSPSSDPLSSTSVTSNESGASVMEGITYTQGVVMAEKFREVYYPAYVKLYDEQQEMEARGEKVSETERERLLQMHKRLEQMKKEMVVAGQRG